jgi:hypothetical protein
MGSDLDLLVEGTALRRMGLEQGPLGGDLIDERGRATTGWWAWANQAAAHLRGPSTMLPAARGETRPSDEFQSMMQTVRKELSAAASDLKDAARSMKGGPALVPATTDR